MNRSYRLKERRSLEVGRQELSIKAGCEHILLLFKGQVVGAHKINPEIGQVVSDPKDIKRKFIRYFHSDIRIPSHDFFSGPRLLGLRIVTFATKWLVME